MTQSECHKTASQTLGCRLCLFPDSDQEIMTSDQTKGPWFSLKEKIPFVLSCCDPGIKDCAHRTDMDWFIWGESSSEAWPSGKVEILSCGER